MLKLRATMIAVAFAAAAFAQSPGRTLEVKTAGGVETVRCEVIRITLSDEQGRPAATMQAYAYLGDDPFRPVTFFWNGGPGLPSMLLHMGLGAPRVADLATGTGLRGNELTLIDRTDLIYVDPVGTGFSKAIKPARTRDFFGVVPDARAAAQFVAAVVAQRSWQERDIFLCGESYGGIRVAAMLKPLQARGIVPAGLILISPALEMRTLRPRTGSIAASVAAADAVPTLAAVAVADGKRDVLDARADIEAVCRFAAGPLLAAMRADQDIRDLDDEQLRVTMQQFTVGYRDRSLRGRDLYDARLRSSNSRKGGVHMGALAEATGLVLKESFGIESMKGYSKSARGWGFGFRWPGADGKNLYGGDTRATKMIATACKGGRGPRVFLAGGWYDYVVKFAVARRHQLEGAFGECDIELRDYPGGHMIYADPEAHRLLVVDLRSWIDRRYR